MRKLQFPPVIVETLQSEFGDGVKNLRSKTVQIRNYDSYVSLIPDIF